MKLIQTYRNTDLFEKLKSVSSGYPTAEIHWLSFAYSCLQLKKHHPDLPLVLYANEAVIKLVRDVYEFPYTDYHLLNEVDPVKNRLYAWPKIETYSRQTEPFIHIDNDIFIWKPLPDDLFEADLVAQHMEEDSTFYMRVLRHIRKHGIRLPEFMNASISPTHVCAYNAGLLGGHDLDFFKQYVKEIKRFIADHEEIIMTMPEHFLINVVFEQWIFGALSRKSNIQVKTFYKDTIIDFKMPIYEPLAAISSPACNYLHLMSFKQNRECNMMVIRNMYNEYPAYYHRIVDFCRTGNKSSHIIPSSSLDEPLSGSGESPVKKYPRSIRFVLEHLPGFDINAEFDPEYIQQILPIEQKKSFLSIYQIESEKQLLFQSVHKEQTSIMEFQSKQHLFLRDLCTKEKRIGDFLYKISPYVRFYFISKDIYAYLLNSSKVDQDVDLVLICSYNALSDKIEEYIYGKRNAVFLPLFVDPVETDVLIDLFERKKNISIESKLTEFIKIGLFNDILCFMDKQ